MAQPFSQDSAASLASIRSALRKKPVNLSSSIRSEHPSLFYMVQSLPFELELYN